MRNTGSPSDYSDDLYNVYFELIDLDGTVKRVISEFLGPKRSERIMTTETGFQLQIPLQCIPDLVKRLVEKNIAVYQIVRLSRSNDGLGSG